MSYSDDYIYPTVCQVCGDVFEYDEVEHGACYQCLNRIKNDYGAVRAYVLAYPDDFEGFKDNESLSSSLTAVENNEEDYVRFYVRREGEIYETKRLMRDLTDIAYEINQNTVIDVVLEFAYVCGIVDCRIYPYDNSEEMYYVSINDDNITSEIFLPMSCAFFRICDLICKGKTFYIGWSRRSVKLRIYGTKNPILYAWSIR